MVLRLGSDGGGPGHKTLSTDNPPTAVLFPPHRHTRMRRCQGGRHSQGPVSTGSLVPHGLKTYWAQAKSMQNHDPSSLQKEQSSKEVLQLLREPPTNDEVSSHILISGNGIKMGRERINMTFMSLSLF